MSFSRSERSNLGIGDLFELIFSDAVHAMTNVSINRIYYIQSRI